MLRIKNQSHLTADKGYNALIVIRQTLHAFFYRTVVYDLHAVTEFAEAGQIHLGWKESFGGRRK